MMDGQTFGPGPRRDAETSTTTGQPAGDGDADSPERTGLNSKSLSRLLRRARGLFSSARDVDAMERLDAFLSDEAAEGNGRTREERALLFNVMKLRDIRVDDVMVPRADIVAVELSASLEETLEALRQGQHSRLPVYRETLDDPVGVVHLKDLALSYGFGASSEETFSLANHLRGVLVAPPSMRILTLFERMQAQRRHMALVIDEYGGVDGIVTSEDIIEQIVGEIEDEHDGANGPEWRREAPRCYVASARAYVDDFEAEIGRSLSRGDWDEDIDTLGGLVFMLSGRIPARGEVIPHPDGHEFEVLDADPRRIKRLRVRIADVAETEDRDQSAEPAPTGADDPTRARGGDAEESAGRNAGQNAGQETGDDAADGVRADDGAAEAAPKSAA